MSATGHNEYAPGYAASQVKHHEWRTAENSAAHLIPRLQEMVKIKPALKLLDVGAGSGTISTSLAKYMSKGQVTATDLSQEILDRAKEAAEFKGVSNVRFEQASVYQLPYQDASFDVTHAHQVLCHLDAPVDAIREMVRVTKPGGIVSLRESDIHMWCVWPELPSLVRSIDIIAKTIVANGGSDKGGRQLVSWAMKAGVARENIVASFGTWCYSAAGDRRVWADAMNERLRRGQMRGKMIEMKIARGDELDQMADDWARWCDTEDATLGIMNGEVIIEKK